MEFGEPDLKIGEFSLWVVGRQFPEANDYWDGNWLNVVAQVEASDARVRARGPILHLGEIKRFAGELVALNRTVAGEAHLFCIEPNLNISLLGDKLGHIEMTARITPDHMTQRHEFTSTLDQTFLSSTLKNLERILSEYPIKDPNQEST